MNFYKELLSITKPVVLKVYSEDNYDRFRILFPDGHCYFWMNEEYMISFDTAYERIKDHKRDYDTSCFIYKKVVSLSDTLDSMYSYDLNLELEIKEVVEL